MAMFVFPAHIFNPKSVRADPVVRTISGGETIDGNEDVIAVDGGGRWRIDFSEIDLDTVEKQRSFDAWISHLDGGVTECLVPLLSLKTAPRPYQGKQPARPSDLEYDDRLYPNYVRYAAPYITATVTENADLRATELAISVTQGSPILGGEKFSVGNRGYKIVRKIAEDRFLIRPPLRESISADAPIEFSWPVVKCRMVSGQDFSSAIRLQRFGDASISFIEVI